MSIYKGNNLVAGLPDISGKANVSFDNLTDAGNIVAAKASMPSDTSEDLTLGASGSQYTAPSDGYVSLRFSLNNNGSVNIKNEDTNLISDITAVGNWGYALWLPVKKGDTYSVSYQNTIIVNQFKFIYAEGSKSEA